MNTPRPALAAAAVCLIFSLACSSSPEPSPAPEPVAAPAPPPATTEPACDQAACKRKRDDLERKYLRENGGRREVKARLWWMSLKGNTPPSVDDATSALVEVIDEGLDAERDVLTCEAECSGREPPPAPPKGCAELCTKAVACEVSEAEAMKIDLKVPGVTADLWDCVDKCAWKAPLSAEDIECWNSMGCVTLSRSARSMKPGECPDLK